MACSPKVQTNSSSSTTTTKAVTKDSVYVYYTDTLSTSVGPFVKLDHLLTMASDSTPVTVSGEVGQSGVKVIQRNGQAYVAPITVTRYKTLYKTKYLTDTLWRFDSVYVRQEVRPDTLAYKIADVVSDGSWWWIGLLLALVLIWAILRKK